MSVVVWGPDLQQIFERGMRHFAVMSCLAARLRWRVLSCAARLQNQQMLMSLESELAGLHKPLLRFAQLQLRNDSMAEDVVSETLLALLEKPGDFEGRGSLHTFATEILKFKIIDVLRKRGRAFASALCGLPSLSQRDERMQFIRRAMRRLAPESDKGPDARDARDGPPSVHSVLLTFQQTTQHASQVPQTAVMAGRWHLPIGGHLVNQMRQHLRQVASDVTVAHAELLRQLADGVAAQGAGDLIGRHRHVLPMPNPGVDGVAHAALLELADQTPQATQATHAAGSTAAHATTLAEHAHHGVQQHALWAPL
jgi:DNA-directed RNA polymerase specialized sigma24 family protein